MDVQVRSNVNEEQRRRNKMMEQQEMRTDRKERWRKKRSPQQDISILQVQEGKKETGDDGVD